MPIFENTQQASAPSALGCPLEGEVVDETYAVTVDPLRYDELLSAWRRYLDIRVPNCGDLKAEGRFSNPALEIHFQRAVDIFQRIGRRRQRGSATAQLAKLPMYAALLTEHGEIVAANPIAAQTLPSAETPLQLSALDFAPEIIESLKNWMTRRCYERQPVIILPVSSEKNQRNSFVICAPSPGDITEELRTQHGAKKYFLLTTIDLTYDGGLRSLLKQTFRLTKAEIEVAIALAQGLSPAVISETRQVSLETVRTQIKGVLDKVDTNAVTDLVRILNGVAASYSICKLAGGLAELETAPQSNRRAGVLALPDGRRLAYEESGAENGRPLLFLHDMLHAPTLTDAAIDAARRRNWRLIAPSRAGFGESDDLAETTASQRMDAVCADLRRLLDHLNIDRVIVAGHLSGGFTALRLAAFAPERVRAMALVSCVPNWRNANLAHLPFRVGLLARTTLVAPQALTLLARAGAACVDAGCEDRVIDMFHSDMPMDKLALRRPEVHRIVANGLRHGVAQGVGAFCQECRMVLRDWTPEARQTTQPMHLLHGAHDITCRATDAQRFVDTLPNAGLTTIDDAGLNLLYTHWPKLFEVAHALDERVGQGSAEC